jgi:hypothetical protein
MNTMICPKSGELPNFAELKISPGWLSQSVNEVPLRDS